MPNLNLRLLKWNQVKQLEVLNQKRMPLLNLKLLNQWRLKEKRMPLKWNQV
jgi:hypothetical protein